MYELLKENDTLLVSSLDPIILMLHWFSISLHPRMQAWRRLPSQLKKTFLRMFGMILGSCQPESTKVGNQQKCMESVGKCQSRLAPACVWL